MGREPRGLRVLKNYRKSVTLSEAKGLCYRKRGFFANDQNDIMMSLPFFNTLRGLGVDAHTPDTIMVRVSSMRSSRQDAGVPGVSEEE
jgi:hypothetical protein